MRPRILEGESRDLDPSHDSIIYSLCNWGKFISVSGISLASCHFLYLLY